MLLRVFIISIERNIKIKYFFYSQQAPKYEVLPLFLFSSFFPFFLGIDFLDGFCVRIQNVWGGMYIRKKKEKKRFSLFCISNVEVLGKKEKNVTNFLETVFFISLSEEDLSHFIYVNMNAFLCWALLYLYIYTRVLLSVVVTIFKFNFYSSLGLQNNNVIIYHH